MTRAEAIDLLRQASFDTVQEHQKQITVLFKTANALQQDYKAAETRRDKRLAEFFYLKKLEEIDARLTLINR